MVIEAAKGGHTQVVKLLLEWPNRFLINSAADQQAQLSVVDAPLEEVSLATSNSFVLSLW